MSTATINLKTIEHDTLISELRNRGYSVYDSTVRIEDFDFDAILSYVESEGYLVEEGTTILEILEKLPSYELKDLFCDLCGVNHHTNKDDLLKLIAEKL